MNGKGGKPMRVRPATQVDLEAVLLIYEGARRFMAQSGNPGQWGTRYPSRETVEADIAGERCYVCEEEGRDIYSGKPSHRRVVFAISY